MQCAAGCIDEQIGVLLPSYEFGHLSGPEKEKFEAHLQACQGCAKEIISMKPIWEMIHAHRDAFDHPERYIKRSTFFAVFHLKPMVAFAATAMLLLAIGIGYFNQPYAWRQASTIELGGTVMGHRSSDELVTGVSALKAGNLGEARGLLETACRKDSADYVARYYLGVCALQQSESGVLWMRRVDQTGLRVAIESFNQAAALSEDIDSKYQARSRLGLVKAYLLTNQWARALEEIRKIESLSGTDRELAELKQSATMLKAKLQ